MRMISVKLPTCQMMRTSKMIIHWTSYCSGAIILLECNHDELSQFGPTEEICIYNNMKLIVYFSLQTLWFERKLNAYQVVRPTVNTDKKCLEVKNLIFPYPLSTFDTMNNMYVPLINHEITEFAVLWCIYIHDMYW